MRPHVDRVSEKGAARHGIPVLYSQRFTGKLPTAVQLLLLLQHRHKHMLRRRTRSPADHHRKGGHSGRPSRSLSCLPSLSLSSRVSPFAERAREGLGERGEVNHVPHSRVSCPTSAHSAAMHTVHHGTRCALQIRTQSSTTALDAILVTAAVSCSLCSSCVSRRPTVGMNAAVTCCVIRAVLCAARSMPHHLLCKKSARGNSSRPPLPLSLPVFSPSSLRHCFFSSLSSLSLLLFHQKAPL